MSSHLIKHNGVVRKRENDKLEVALVNVSACSACHAKAACNVANTDNKVLEITDSAGLYHEGEYVDVLFDESQGVKALLLAYVYPFLILMAVLITVWQITSKEAISAIFALGSLVPYYLSLALFKSKWKKEFEIKLVKLEN